MSLDWVRVGCGVRFMFVFCPSRVGDACEERRLAADLWLPGVGGDAPSGVSMHSSEEEMSKTVGRGSGCQPGWGPVLGSTIGL